MALSPPREVATELPQKVEMDLICPLTDVQRTEYARICTEGLDRLGDDEMREEIRRLVVEELRELMRR